MSPGIPPTSSPWTIHRVLMRTPIRLTLWILLGIWFLGGWLSEPYLIGRGQDWAYFVHHTTVATRSWLDYGQVPMWNPWFCGGIPALANIQTDALSPDLLATLWLDQPVASALRRLIFIVVGLEGTWHYARRYGVRGFGAVMAAAVFMFSGRFMMVFWDGHLPFLGFALAPWVFYGLERAYHRIWWGILAAAALTWIFFYGGAVATPLIVAMMGFIVARDVLERLLAPTEAVPRGARSDWYRPLLALAFVGALTVLLSLPRLVPVLETLVEYPRTWTEPEALSLFHVSGMLFLPPQSWGYFASGTSYLGIGVGVAFLAALLLRERAMLKLLVAGVVGFDLAMGDAGPLHLWKLMHAFPVVDNVRAAFRFTFLVGLFVAIGGGRAVWWLEERIGERARRLFERARERGRTTPRWLAIAGAFTVSGAATLVIGGHGPLATKSRLSEIPRHEIGPEAPGDFRQARGTRWIAQVWPRVNVGSVACFEEQHFPQSGALLGDRPHEEWLAEGEGSVRRLGWSPNEIDLEVITRAGGVVAVNQNAARGWSARGGTITEADGLEGLLAARVGPGRVKLTLTYEEPGIIVLMAVSFLTMLALAGWLLMVRPWRADTEREERGDG